MKTNSENLDFKNRMVSGLRTLTEIIAFVLCMILIVTAGVITYNALLELVNGNPTGAILDSLFVVILLELFYVIRSFIKRGSMNVGVIINVAIIAAVKELIFKLNLLSLQMAISFAVIFLSLGLLYIVEMIHYERHKGQPDEI